MSRQNNQQPYFPHDANSRNKDRLIRLRMEHGVSGYGVYFMLLERLRNEDDFTAELDYQVLSFDFDCDVDLIRSVITDFGLFVIYDEGRRFYSVELTDKMNFMLEAKRKRTEAARKAAECRWGKKDSAYPPSVATRGNEVVASDAVETAKQPELPLDYGDRLRNEIETLRNDDEWTKAIMTEFNISMEMLETYLETFRLVCVGNGLPEGHKNIADAKYHCRNYINKILSNDKVRQNKARRQGGKVLEKETENIKRSEMEQKKRREESETAAQNSQSGDNIFRNKGYEPHECTMRQLYDPEWIENNPPTHPEWIGRFRGFEKVEDVVESLKLEEAVV